MHLSGVLMPAARLPKGQAVEDFFFSKFSLPSFSTKDSGGIDGAPRQNYDHLRFRTRVHRAFFILSVVAVMGFLLLSTYLCLLEENKGFLAKARFRKLSGNGDGEGKGDEAGASPAESCAVLKYAASFSREASGGRLPAAGPAANPTGAVPPEKGRPQKRTKKTRCLEQDTSRAADSGKKAKFGEQPICLSKPFCRP